MDYIKKYIHWPFRLYLSFVFIPIGYGKLVNPSGLISMELPSIIAYLVGPFQLLGSLFILIGAFIITEISSGVVIVNQLIGDIITRIGAAMISIIMIGAIYMHLVKWEDAVDTIYFPLFLLIISLVFLFRGNKIFE